MRFRISNGAAPATVHALSGVILAPMGGNQTREAISYRTVLLPSLCMNERHERHDQIIRTLSYHHCVLRFRERSIVDDRLFYGQGGFAGGLWS